MRKSGSRLRTQFLVSTSVEPEYKTDFLDPLGLTIYRAVDADVEQSEQIAEKWNNSKRVLDRELPRLAHMVVYEVSCRGHRVLCDRKL